MAIEERPEQGPSVKARISGALVRLGIGGTASPASPEDLLWNEYMARERHHHHLVALLKDQAIKPVFRQRAMLSLLAPDIRKLPFPVHADFLHQRSHNFLTEDTPWRELLQEAEATQAAQLVETYMGRLRGRNDRNSQSNLHCYHRVVVALLPIIPQPQAESLFSHFRVDTVEPWVGIEGPHPYYPIRFLYADPAVDEAWKRKGAQQIHQIIGEERSKLPIEEPTKSGERYARRLGEVVWEDSKDSLPLSTGFFQDEIVFMLDIDPGGLRLFGGSWGSIDKVMDLLALDSIRQAFVRNMLSLDTAGQPRNFILEISRNGKDIRRVTSRILAEFPEDQKLKESIDAHLRSFQEARRHQRRVQALLGDKAILAKMKA